MMLSSFLICIFCFGTIWSPTANTYNIAFKIPISLDSPYLKENPEIVWNIVFPKVMDSEESISIFEKLEPLVNTLVNPSNSNQYYPANIQAIEYSETDTELISPIKIIDKNLLNFPKPEYNAHMPVSKLSGGGLIDTLQKLHLEKLEKHNSSPLEIVTIILNSNTEIIYPKKKCLVNKYKILLYKPGDNINDLFDSIISLLTKADMNVDELNLWNDNKLLNHKHNLSCNFERIESRSSETSFFAKQKFYKFRKDTDFRLTLYWIHPQFNVGVYSQEIQKFITNSAKVSEFFDVLKPLSNLEIIFIPFYIKDNQPKGFFYDVSPSADNSPTVLATVLPAKSFLGTVQPFWLEYTVPLIHQHFNTTILPSIENNPNHFVSILGFSNEDMSVLPTNQLNGSRMLHDQVVQSYNQLLDGCIRILYEPITTSTENANLPCNSIIRNQNNEVSLEKEIADHIKYLYNGFQMVAEKHNAWKFFAAHSITKEPVLIDLYFISPDRVCLKGIDQMDFYNFYVKLPQIKKIFKQHLNAHINLGYGKYKNLNQLDYVLSTDQPNVLQAMTSSPGTVWFNNSKCGERDDAGTLEYIRTVYHPETVGFRNEANKYIILFYDNIQHPDVSWMYGVHMESYFSILAAQNEMKGYHLFVVTSPEYSRAAKTHYNTIQKNTPYNIIVYDKNKDSLNHKISYAILEHLKLQGVISL